MSRAGEPVDAEAQRAARTIDPPLEAYRAYREGVAQAFDMPRPGWAVGETYCCQDHDDFIPYERQDCPVCRAAL